MIFKCYPDLLCSSASLTEQDIETRGNTYYNDSTNESCQVADPQLVIQKQGTPQSQNYKCRKQCRKHSSPMSLT